VAVLIFVSVIVVPAWLLPTSGQAFPMVQVLRWLGVALAAFAVPASFLGFRVLTFEVDDLGVRVRRPMRSFEVRWDAMGRIESAQFRFFRLAYDIESQNRRTYGLRTKDDTIAGVVMPVIEVGRENGEKFERALLAFAAEHELPVVEVSWRATLSWKQRRRGIRG
jgi:hypothetical protein